MPLDMKRSFPFNNFELYTIVLKFSIYCQGIFTILLHNCMGSIPETGDYQLCDKYLTLPVKG